MRLKTCSTIGAALLGALLVPSLAQAQTVNCEDVVAANPDLTPIFGTGGSAIRPVLRNVAVGLWDQDLLLFFSDGGGACVGQADYAKTAPPYRPESRPYLYWTKENVQQSCVAPNIKPQFLHMGNGWDECIGGPEQPENVKDFGGPVQTANIIVPKASSANSISAEALKFLLLHGASASNISPWTNDDHLIIRSRDAFVHLFIVSALQAVPGAELNPLATKGNPVTGAPCNATLNDNQPIADCVAQLGNSSPNTPIGYVSGSNADANRDKVKTLAFQGYGQECGYWPDSSPDKRDKINVRTGLYSIWTPGHFFAVDDDDDGVPDDPDVANLIGWVTGRLDSPGDLDVTRRVIAAGDVPQCAMRATRPGLAGPIASYAPPKPCDCYFESIAEGKVPSYCDPCSTDDDCAGGDRKFCNYGFCELYRRD
jgi:hypothetical protein